MSESAANVSCPECGGELSPTEGTANLFQCVDCGDRLHQIAARHVDLLEDLSQNDDPAIADLADTILAYQGGSQ